MFKKILTIISIVVLVFMPMVTHAASFFFSPSSLSKQVAQTFVVDVFVASADQSTNAVSGVISFPKQLVQVVSLSQSGSVISLWVQPPSFSNTDGTIRFEGISFNPGFTGTSGKLFSITLKGTAEGLAGMSFSSASALANDGLGTQILKGTGTGSFRIVGTPKPTDPTTPSVKPTEPTPVNQPPQVVSGGVSPVLTSPTHPNPQQWYASNDVVVNWEAPKGVTDVRVLFDAVPDSTPTVIYGASVTERVMSDVADGVWYFHAQFKTAAGWGPVAHFPVQIDTVPPQPFTISFPHEQEDPTDPRPIALFNTPDLLSGISHYEIKIGNEDFYKVDPREIESNPYSLPTQQPGKATIVVRAFDQAGNVMTSAEDFSVAALPAPNLSNYPTEIETGDILIVNGESFPSSNIEVALSSENGKTVTIEERTNSLGNFRIIWPKELSVGVYQLQVIAIDDRGAKSLPSERITIVVKEPVFLTLGSRAITFVSFIFFCVIVGLGILAISFKGWYALLRLRRRLQKEISQVDDAVSESFQSLHTTMYESISLLEQAHDKRRLTKEEKNILNTLKAEVDRTEKFTKKKIHDIEEAVDE